GMVQLPRECRGGGRVVDVDGTWLHARKCACGSEGNRPQVIVITYTGEDEISALRRGLRCWRESAAIFSDPFFCLRSGAIEDGELVTSTFYQVTSHGITHDPKTYERYFSHSSNSFDRTGSGGRSVTAGGTHRAPLQ